jgi:hypothetical protein
LNKYRLPNGLEIVHRNKAETDFLYSEIFKNRSYASHGITLSAGDTVFDVGANIGMAALFFHTNNPDVRVFSFEPNPPIFELLQANFGLTRSPGEQDARDLLEITHRFDAVTVDCRLRTLSEVIAELRIETIDMLKATWRRASLTC